ncbi:MAG: pitrilysin family protein, partial [Phycisphaeraceae bacterium]
MALQFHHQQLSNGLTVIAECNDESHTAAVGFFVKAGTRDEDKPLMGVSHFLEHMMFKGTARRTSDAVNREFDEIGANYNAFTTQELTAYFAQVLPEFLPRAVDLIGDMLRPTLRADAFDMEKNVILEEIGMYEDRPHWRLHDILLEEHFDGHPLSFRVLGTTESIKVLSLQKMRDYFAHRYSPDNITVAAAGRLNFDKLIADVAQAAQAWQPTGAVRTYEQPKLEPAERTVTDAKLSRHYVAMLCPGPSSQDQTRYAAKVLADLIGDEEGSRLYWALVDPGLADEADFSFHPQDHVGSFYAYASCDPDRAGPVEKLLLETIDVSADSIDAAEIDRVKNKLATQVTLHGENPGGRMSGLGSQWTYLGVFLPLDAELERI